MITSGQYTLGNIPRLVDEIDKLKLSSKILIDILVAEAYPKPGLLSSSSIISTILFTEPFFVLCLHFSTINSITNSTMVSSLCSSKHRLRQGMSSTQLQLLRSMSTIHNRLLGKLAAGMSRPYVGCVPTFLCLRAGYPLGKLDWWV